MPGIFVLKPLKLLFGLFKLKIIEIVQSLSCLYLNVNIGDENNGSIFFNLGTGLTRKKYQKKRQY